SRQQAIDYLASHTALSQHEVETEVDRYISWPGQALSYKLGELTIRRLRAEAEAKLGPKFDIKGFHDTFLDMGAVPLNVLEGRRSGQAGEELAPHGCNRARVESPTLEVMEGRMGILDGLLGQLGESDLTNLAAKVGLSPEHVEMAVKALAKFHPMEVDTAEGA